MSTEVSTEPEIVAVIGAGSGVGLLVVQRLLQVTPPSTIIRAVVRSPSKHVEALRNAAAAAAGVEACPVDSQRLQVVAGDVTQPPSLTAALAGATGVIIASGGTTFWSAEAVDNLGVGNVAAAAKVARTVQRVVLLSGMCAHPANTHHPVRVILNTLWKWRTLEHKYAGELRLRACSVPCTIVRAPFLLDEPAGTFALQMDVDATRECRLGTGPFTVGRGDVAAVCVKALFHPAAAGHVLSVYKQRHHMAARRLTDAPGVFDKQLDRLFDGLVP